MPPDERAEYTRIYHEALKAKLSAGTVHVYLLNPAGHPVGSLHVADASDPARLTALLEGTIARLKVAPGGPLVEPCCQSKAPAAGPGSVVLHLTARYLRRQGQELVRLQPVLGRQGGDWSDLPSEDWIVLTPADGKKLLPPGAVRPGASWPLDRGVTAGLLTHFFPPTENTDVGNNRLDQQELRATVLSVKEGVARARIEGRLRMRHPFYYKDTDEYVDADVVGLLEFEPARATLRSLRLVTGDARYGRAGQQQPFGVAVASLP